jgi:hypothetical protein
VRSSAGQAGGCAVNGNDAASDRLSHRTRLEAGLAILPAVATAAWLSINAPQVAAFYLLCVMLIAVPLLAATRRAFVVLCLIIAGLFVPLSVLGVFLGLFLFLQSAVVLLAVAGLVARRRRVRVVAHTVAWLVASGVLAAFGVAFGHHFFGPSDIIVVQEPAPDRDSAMLNHLSDSIYRARFWGVGVATSSSDRQLNVEVPGWMPERGRQRLLNFVRAQPGVVTAYWCGGTRCNG